MKRIDRIISEQTNYSRKDIKKLINKRLVIVNGEIVISSDTKYDEENISIFIDGAKVEIREHIYLVLNKPKGYVSTTDQEHYKSVLELVPEKYKTRELFPAGRLDKDTTGLMIITDDGEFAHEILSPKKHVKKIYEVVIDNPLTKEMVDGFKNGVMLNDGVCKSADLEINGKNQARVCLHEGRYHQIKRMFGCYNAKVLELNRICIGNYYLNADLKLGDVKELSSDDINLIKEK